MLTEIPVGLHVFWKEEGLLQGLDNMACMPPMVMPDEGIPGNRDTVYLQFRRLIYVMDGAFEPQDALLGCQRSWTSYFFGPGTASVVYFLFEGLSCPPQEPLGVSFSLAHDWSLARD